MFLRDDVYLTDAPRGQDPLVEQQFSTPKLPHRSTEPRRLRQLPWPRNLFGELATIEELMAEAINPNDVCGCGRRGRHRHNVSQTLWDSSDFDIIWFRSGTCKTRWIRMRRGDDVS